MRLNLSKGYISLKAHLLPSFIAIQIMDIIIFSLFYFPPYFIIQEGIVQDIVNYSRLMVSTIIILRVFPKHYFNKRTIVLFGSLFMLGFVTLGSGIAQYEIRASIMYFMRDYLPMIAFILYCARRIGQSASHFINNIYNFFYALCLLYIVFFLISPDGIFLSFDELTQEYKSVYLWGNKNDMTPICFACFTFMGIKRVLHRDLGFLKDGFLFVSMFIIMNVTKCKTGLLCVCLFATVLLLINNTIFRSLVKHFDFRLIYVFYLFVQLNIINGTWLSEIGYVLKRLFRENHTFFGRNIVWRDALDQIQMHPLLGLGPGAIASKRDGVLWYAHNGYLELLLRAGIIGLIIFLMIQTHLCHIIYQCKDDKIKPFIEWTYFIVCMIAIVEAPFMDARYMIILPLAYYIDDLVREKKSIFYSGNRIGLVE